ncbi:Fic family protein [Variovorax sp. JS1663]|uniref:Fic family protein n=1 Tax=Variovorax sp. JS1663 TaxID=1851577 RepID=UPI001302C7BD|nr:Fic family protein [Variovorax sp. JS1663]
MDLKQITDLHKRELAYHIGMAGTTDGISIGELMDKCSSIQDGDLGRTAVWRRLKQLGMEGLAQLIDAGSRRSAYYIPTDALRRAALRMHLATDARTRPHVAYDRGMLDSYVPNETRYLRSDEVESLHAACAPGTLKRGDRQDRDMRRFMSDLSYASSRLEGVDYGHLATKSFFEEDTPISNLAPVDRKVLMNHFQAAKFIVEGIHQPTRDGDVGINEHDIRSIHAILSSGLLSNPMRQGAIRNTAVRISSSSYIPPAIPAEIERLFSQIVRKAAEIIDPYEQSLFLLVHVPYLQPFHDCNKRVARLCTNIPLLRNGILPISWLDVNKDDMEFGLAAVYEQRDPRILTEVYVQACHRSFESFTITQAARDPDEIDLRYDNELRQVVRAAVLDSIAITAPASVEGADSTAFVDRVTEILGACLGNPFVGAAYGLRLPDIQRFAEREAALESHCVTDRATA